MDYVKNPKAIEDKSMEIIYDYVKDLGLTDDEVRVVSRTVHASGIQNVISQLDFVVLSSLWEGLPLTPIEAYSVGKTVIGTAVDGTQEIIRTGIDGYLVESKNATQIAEKIDVLIEYPEVRKKMEAQAIRWYQAEFSFEKLKKSYLHYYEGLREN